MLSLPLSPSDRFVHEWDCVCILKDSVHLAQLVDVFLNEKWSDYVSKYPNLSERHKNVSPRSVYGLLTR